MIPGEVEDWEWVQELAVYNWSLKVEVFSDSRPWVNGQFELLPLEMSEIIRRRGLSGVGNFILILDFLVTNNPITSIYCQS